MLTPRNQSVVDEKPVMPLTEAEKDYILPPDPNSLDDMDLAINGFFLPKEWLTTAPPDYEFCVNPLIPMGAVTLLVGHGGTGKSLLALKMAIHTALGISVLGAKTSGGTVAYLSLEDPETIVWRRIFKIFHGLPEEVRQRADELEAKMLLICRYGILTHIAVNNSGKIEPAQIADDLSALLQWHGIKCIFVDTLVRTHTLPENDNAQMGALLVAFEKIVKKTGCAVVLIHHLPKSSDGKFPAAARGASAITSNARSAMVLKSVDDKEADSFAEEGINSISKSSMI